MGFNQPDPKSLLGPLGWTLLLVLAGLVAMQSSHGVRNTLWYQYRPNNFPVDIAPFAMFIVWTTAQVALAVAFYYFLTVTSNSGWINNLFPNLSYDYDAMAGLILVCFLWMKGYGYFFWLMDSWNYTYSVQNVKIGTQISESFQSKVSDDSLQQRAARSTERGSLEINDKVSVVEFKQRVVMYHLNNLWVRWGMFLYSVAFLVVGTIVMAYLARKYGNGKNDHSYLVIFGLWVFTLFVILLGFIYQCYTSFGFPNNNKWESQITPSLIHRRTLENMTH